MITPNLFSKSYNLGRRFFTNSPKLRLLTPKINATLFDAPFSELKSQQLIHIPEKPKKPLTPFFQFIKEHRPILLKKHPELKLTEVIKKCADDWKNIDLTLKQRFESKYREEMAVYAKIHLEYSAKLTDEQRAYIKELAQGKKESKKKRKVKMKLRGLDKPKKPPSSFVLYLMDQARIRNRKLNELMIEMKGDWDLLDESEKLQYAEKAKIAMTKYKKELEDWETKMLQEGNTDVIRHKILEEKRPISSKKGKPKTKMLEENSNRSLSKKTSVEKKKTSTVALGNKNKQE